MKVLSIFAFLVIFLLLVSGCSAPSPVTTYTSTTSLPSQLPTTTPASTTVTPAQTVTQLATITVVPITKVTPAPTARVTTVPTTSGGTVVCDCSSDRYNCADFSTQAAAQACYNYCITQGIGDIHGLDGDKNGKACESNK